MQGMNPSFKLEDIKGASGAVFIAGADTVRNSASFVEVSQHSSSFSFFLLFR